MTVVQRQSKAITASVLRTEDPDTPANQIIYDIMQPPSFGQLVLADNMTHPLKRFTQVSVLCTGSHCAFSPNLFHGQITQIHKNFNQMSSPEKTKNVVLKKFLE